MGGDGYGYYLNAAAFFEDHQPNVDGQMKVCELHPDCPEIITNPSGKKVVRWGIGFPLLSGPIFIVMLALEKLIPISLDPALLVKFGIPFFRGIALPLTSLALFILTLFALPKILREMNRNPPPQKTDIFEIITLGFFSFPIIWYITYSPSYSHVAEAALVTLAILAFLRDKPFLLGIALGISTLIRYTSGVFFIPFLLYYFFVKKDQPKTISFLGGILPFFAMLAIFFQVQFGALFGSPYLKEFILDPGLMLVNMFRIFFDLDRGLLVWTPLFLLAIYGIWKWNDVRKYPLLACIALNVVVYSTFNAWDAGWGFSNRYFAVFFPVHVMGLFVLYSKPLFKKIIFILTAYSVLLFFLFLGMSRVMLDDVWFFTRLLHYYFVDGNWVTFPQTIINNIPLIRVLKGDL